jgi:hypothetical protein
VADVKLTPEQIRRIRLAQSSAEIAEIVSHNLTEQAEAAAQAEAENPHAPRKRRYISGPDGFLIDIGE